jgi:DNA-directed RNA polymerase subunit F
MKMQYEVEVICRVMIETDSLQSAQASADEIAVAVADATPHMRGDAKMIYETESRIVSRSYLTQEYRLGP